MDQYLTKNVTVVYLKGGFEMKKLLTLAGTILLAVSIIGCSPEVPETVEPNTSTESETPAVETEANEEVTIQFMHTMVEQERQEVINGIIADFEAENPGIKIEQIPTDEDSYETKITALGGSGELPAIMEFSQDQAKQNAKNEFIDFSAVKEVIDAKGEASFFDGVLSVIKTEDGADYTGVPIGGWVQGIWYNKTAFADKNLAAPDTWDNIMTAAKAFSDPSNRKYGIAIPTANDGFSQQGFSQFALSNNANVLDASGNAVFNSPEMIEALTYYQSLYAYTMPGSNDVPVVKDAFMNGSAPMAIYSTYMIPSLYEAGTIGEVGFAVPTNKVGAAFGHIGLLSIKADMAENERAASIKFLSYMLQDEVNIKWLHMSPGGQQPVLKAVAESDAYLSNPVIESFAEISGDISGAFNNLQVFGSIEGKNFLIMGDITNTGLISDAVNRVTVKGEDPAEVAADVNAEIEALLE